MVMRRTARTPWPSENAATKCPTDPTTISLTTACSPAGKPARRALRAARIEAAAPTCAGEMRKLRRPGHVLGRRHVRESQQGRHVQRMPIELQGASGLLHGLRLPVRRRVRRLLLTFLQGFSGRTRYPKPTGRSRKRSQLSHGSIQRGPSEVTHLSAAPLSPAQYFSYAAEASTKQP